MALNLGNYKFQSGPVKARRVFRGIKGLFSWILCVKWAKKHPSRLENRFYFTQVQPASYQRLREAYKSLVFSAMEVQLKYCSTRFRPFSPYRTAIAGSFNNFFTASTISTG